ncbi:MAG: response regulator transcription factor [Ignavibacteria bacterium]|nr:response regulator transcription factor [Ignavibacteria bacterium]MBK7444708.1 response regulator transcription factor [Ignavibacteria bacterium]MBK8383750.1 response regulator transcription factor [Ignavibacteria bacterium]MBK9403758.1 response regulator transcription factor [Ignavibacteria bacterium]MBL0107418.1 response regulator transcription factor [Ignavibacteria bacterium]
MKKILLIDDDEKLTDLLKDYLSKYNFSSHSSDNPLNALNHLKNNSYDLIVLDIMLPEMDGFETLKEIRKTSSIPVIMLTARGETTDKIVGLELGADDYIAKPFEPRELVARMQSVFRRTDGSLNEDELISFKDLLINPMNRTVELSGKNIELTSTEFDILMLFAKNNGKVLSRDFLMQKTKGASWQYYDRSIDVMVSRLRNKLKQKNFRLIKTVQSVGYIFYAEKEE